MPGENEKQPGQAPEQLPPDWEQYARERSECPSSARGDGRRMEVFAVKRVLSRGFGSEQSIISEYEKSLQFDEQYLSIMLAEWEAKPLICPVCTKYNLRITNGVVVCQCGLYIPSHSPELSEQKLRTYLEDSVNDHSTHCPHTPEFSVTDGTEEKPSLLMYCLVSFPWDPVVRADLQFVLFPSWWK
ncbi:RPA-interacting protein isoform X4 [Ictidomys tridecemlineatus]